MTVNSDLLSSILGAVIGFSLAQAVDLVKVARSWWLRPVLAIKPAGDGNQILRHAVPTGDYLLDEAVYGFEVHNTGRQIALNVRFQILEIEADSTQNAKFKIVFQGARDLFTYGTVEKSQGDLSTTIVPGGSTIVSLAAWREDHGVIFPDTKGIPDYYEEFCHGSEAYRFAVVAFADNAKFVKHTFTLRVRPESTTESSSVDVRA